MGIAGTGVAATGIGTGTTLLLAVLLGTGGGTLAAFVRRRLSGVARPAADLGVALLLVGAAWRLGGGGAQDGVVPTFLLVYLVATSLGDARGAGVLPRRPHLRRLAGHGR